MSDNGERLGWFLVEEEIARTVSGRLLRAKDTDLGVVSAILVLNPAIANDATIVKRFRDEVRLARSAEHPGFSRLLDVVMQDDVTFVVSEWIAGESLADRLSRGPIDVVEAMRFVRKACEALATLHRFHLVHRGLSPDALIVRPDGFLVVVRMSAVTPGEARQRTGRIDKVPYAAPEILGQDPATSASDVFSLGSILYALIEGSPPDPERPARLSDVSREVPPILDEILERVLSPDPQARPKDAAALIEELLPLEALLGISDPHAAVGATVAPPPRLKKDERDLPTRETSRVTEPTHVMALPPYSQFSLEAPTGASILPEMLVDELLMPRGRVSRDRKAKPLETEVGSPTNDLESATAESPSPVSALERPALSGMSVDDGDLPASTAAHAEPARVTHSSVPRPVTAAHSLPISPDDQARDDRAGGPSRAAARVLVSDEATELSLTPPSQMATPSGASEDHTLPFDTIDPRLSSTAPDLVSTPIPTAQVTLGPNDDGVPWNDIAHTRAETLPESSAPDAGLTDSSAANTDLLDMSDEAEPLDDDGDEAQPKSTTKDTPPASAQSSAAGNADPDDFFKQTGATTHLDGDDRETSTLDSSTDAMRVPQTGAASTSPLAQAIALIRAQPPALLAATAGVALVLVILVVAWTIGDDEPKQATVATVAPRATPTNDDAPETGDDVETAPPDDAPPDVPPEAVNPRPVDDDRTADANLAARIKTEKVALERGLAKRGLRTGDDDQLDAMRTRASDAVERGAHAEALAELVAARRRAAEIKVDADFIEKKLGRARAAIKTIEKPALRKKASALVGKAAGLLKKKKPTSAHIYLNRALKLVPDT